MEFKRELYIKNLFIPKEIINAFDWVEFNSIEAFKKAVKGDFYNIRDGSCLQINIHDFKDFIFLAHLWRLKPDMFLKQRVHILASDTNIIDEILTKPIPKDMKFDLMLTHPINISDYWDKNRDWLSKNRTVLIQNIHAETIATDICELLEIFNNNNLRFFLLDIDYESFNKLNLDELEKVKFWFFHLKTWIRDDTLAKGNKLDISSKNFYKPIFIDDDLTLYLDAHKESSLWFFALGEYLEDTGETISNSALNCLHKYMDLLPNVFYTDFKINNWRLISYRQIKKMGYFLNEIPLIMSLIQRWLYV